MESNAHVCEDNKEMDMVFNKNVDKTEIEKFENECFEKISKLSLISSLKEEIIKRKWNLEMKVQHPDIDSNRYYSYFIIDIFDAEGERICECDEPNSCLMLCETICYERHKHIVGIELDADKEFLQSVELLIKNIKKYN